MSKNRNIADLLDANGDVKSTHLDNVPAVDLTNLSASNLTSGSIPDARVPASAVQQHATSFDDNKIVNDISTLALRQASDGNRSAYNTNSQFVDVFQDSTGIDTTTNTSRNSNEYVASVQSSTDSAVKLLITGNGTGQTIVDSLGNHTVTVNGGATWSTAQKKFGTSSIYFDGGGDYLEIPDSNDWYLGNSGNGWTFETFFKSLSNTAGAIYQQGINSSNGNPRHHLFKNSDTSLYFYDYTADVSFSQTVPSFETDFRHIALVFDDTNNQIQMAIDGTWIGSATSFSSPSNNSNPLKIGRGQDSSGNTRYIEGYLDGIKITARNVYTLGTNFTPPSNKLDDQILTISSTGNFTSTNVTAPSSVSSMGAIITYQDNAGTNALNTDIVLQLSADGGSNYSTATLVAMPDFSTGIKMAKVNDLSVTAGTSLKYKISFANQSLSKEARIRGVSLQY